MIKSVHLTNMIGIIIFLYLVIMGIGVLLVGEYILGAFDLILGSLYALNFLILRKTKNIDFAAHTVTSLLAVVFIYLTATGGKNGTGFLWSVIFPIVALQLQGHRKGKWYTIVFIISQFLILFILKDLPWLFKYQFFYDNFEIINSRLILIQIAIFIISYSSAKNRHEQYEEIDRANQQKINFFVNLAHEIKTPLTLIGFNLDKYINNHGLCPEMAAIKQNLDKLRRDMVNFLDIEKLERSQVFYNHDQVVNLSEVIALKAELFKDYTERKNIEIIKQIKKHLYIKIDPYALDRILNNLLDNAVRYNKQGGKIKIRTKVKKETVEISISDTGIGMDTVQQQNIFKPYHQISHQKSSIQGMGMGLNIVKKIIDQINGQVNISSQPYKGSTFQIILKKFHGSEDNIIKKEVTYSQPMENITKIELKEPEYVYGKYNVLLVEDNLAMISLLQNSLAYKYNFYYALNGKQALEKLAVIPYPNIIISDIIMDEMDGYEFFETLLKNQLYSSIPFIFLTAKTAHDEKIKGLSKGAVDFICKPFQIDELLAKMNSLIVNQEAFKKVTLTKIGRDLYNFFQKKLDTSSEICLLNEESYKKKILEKLYIEYGISVREIEVIRLLKKGLEYKEVAAELDISINTVRTYVKRIYKKCRVQNIRELVKIFKPLP